MSAHTVGLDLVAFNRDGYGVIDELYTASEAARLRAETDALRATIDLGQRGGVRDLFTVWRPARAIAADPRLLAIAESVLGPNCGAVRATLFDKTPGTNWKVSWHQDVSIAVAEQRSVLGYGPWTEKAGVLHVQPPAAVLASMVTLRLHLDPCAIDNGPVRVIPGSHLDGKLGGAAIDGWRARVPEVPCCADVGGVLVMRPLLLHASSPSSNPSHRRVVHIDYASGALDGGLEWHEWWGRDEAQLRAG